MEDFATTDFLGCSLKHRRLRRCPLSAALPPALGSEKEEEEAEEEKEEKEEEEEGEEEFGPESDNRLLKPVTPLPQCLIRAAQVLCFRDTVTSHKQLVTYQIRLHLCWKLLGKICLCKMPVHM